jgi:coenzyme PQQ precursor peptide PqqA
VPAGRATTLLAGPPTLGHSSIDVAGDGPAARMERHRSIRVAPRRAGSRSACNSGDMIMAWTTPILVEICIGLEINGYLPAEI